MHEQPSPWLYLIINQVMFARIQTHEHEMREVILYGADTISIKRLPTNDLIAPPRKASATRPEAKFIQRSLISA